MAEQSKVGQAFLPDPNENRPGYQKTKVGWIPEEWESCPISQLGSVNYGLTVNAQRRESTDICRYLTVAQFTPRGLDIAAASSIGTLKSDRERFGLRKDDILVVEGNGSRDLVGKADVCPDLPCELLHQNHLLRIRLKKQTYIARLLVAFINSDYFRHHLDPRIITSSGLHTINSSVLGNAPIPLPPLPEQQKIAAILSTCDDAIEATRDLIAAKRNQKKALMQQLLTGKRRLPGFAGEWQGRAIGSLYKTVIRPVTWDDDATYSLLSVRRRSGGVFLRERLEGSQIKTKTMFLARSGDFLISKMQVLHGATGLVPRDLDKCHISGSYIALRPNGSREIDPAFFARISTTPEFYHLTFLSSYGVHIEKMTFNLNWFLKSHVTIPPDVAEQKAVVDVLETADKELAALEAKRAALEQQKKGLMQKLLTGQVRVKT